METLRERILNTLEDLGKQEFETFKWHLKEEFERWWHLQQCVNVGGLCHATRTYTADLIVQTYSSNGAQIMVNVLKKIHRKDLLTMFPSICTDAPTLSSSDASRPVKPPSPTLSSSPASRPVNPPSKPSLFRSAASAGHGGPAVQTRSRNIISIGHEDVVHCDGHENRTTGVGFWRLNGRKIAALCESSYQELMRRQRMGGSDDDTLEKVEELEPTVPELEPLLPAVHTDLQHLGQKVNSITLTPHQLSNVRSTFLCIICRDVMQNPVVGPCCRSLIGCRVCVTQWTRNTPNCPKCRNEAFPDSLFEITGMEGVIAALTDTIRNVKIT